jgi:signal transduction histidine kinase
VSDATVPAEGRVLAVDDNEVYRHAAVRTLRRARFHVDEAATGSEALRLCREQRPDLLLIQVTLPDLTGYEVCRAVRADPDLAGAGVVLTSDTFVATGDRVHGLEQGADAYLVQPVDHDELVATVRAVLRARRERGTAPHPEPAGAHLELMRVLGAVPVALALVDRQLRCTWCNSRFLALGGRSSRDQHEITLSELLPGPFGTALAAEARRVIATGRESSVGLSTPRPAELGGPEVRRAHVVPVGPGASDGIVCSILDPLETRAWALDERLRTRDALIATASHALRDPLGAVLLRLSSLPRLLDRGDDREARARIATACEQLEHMNELIDRFMDASLVGEIRPSEVDLSNVVERVVEDHRDAAAEAGCELRLGATGAIVGAWDGTRLGVVLSHLLDNALKYAPGAPIEVDLAATPTHVRLAVRDHGPGVPPELREEVFRTVTRGDRAAVAGRGLGLWIVRESVQAHGGTVRLESPPDGGAQFVVELPRK